MNYMIHVLSTMWRIKNQPSNSTSCSDNALVRLLVLVASRLYWGLQVMSSFSIWGCVLKGFFEIDIIWRAKSRLKGIEGFNLEHCTYLDCHLHASGATTDHNCENTNINGQYWSPHMSFILKGSQISVLRLKSWFKSKTWIQEYKNKIQISY